MLLVAKTIHGLSTGTPPPLTDLAASLALPAGLTVDPTRNFYLAEVGNIRRVTPDGTTSTVLSNELQPLAFGVTRASTRRSVHRCSARRRRFGIHGRRGRCREVSPRLARRSADRYRRLGTGVMAPDGTLLRSDPGNRRIRRIAVDGTTTTSVGDDTTAILNGTSGLTIDSLGNLYAADSGGHVIGKIAPNGNVSIVAGSGAPGAQDGPPGQAQFQFPKDIVRDAAGTLYVADLGNDQIRICRRRSRPLRRCDGTQGPMSLRGKVALVAGPTSGIGLGIAGTLRSAPRAPMSS